MRQRKQYLLRIPQELYDVYEAWAADEFRSVNAQIEATLQEAARRAGRPRRRAPEREGGSADVQGGSADGQGGSARRGR